MNEEKRYWKKSNTFIAYAKMLMSSRIGRQADLFTCMHAPRLIAYSLCVGTSMKRSGIKGGSAAGVATAVLLSDDIASRAGRFESSRCRGLLSLSSKYTADDGYVTGCAVASGRQRQESGRGAREVASLHRTTM